MDRSLIVRLAAEAAVVWTGRRIARTLARPGGGVALLGEEGPALDLAPFPPLSWLAATGTRLRAEARATGPARAALARELEGRELAGLQMLAGERLVRLDLEGGGWLSLELLGGAGNIYLIDAGGVVRVRLRPGPRPGGGLEPGAGWRPPTPAGEDTAGAPSWQRPAAVPTRPGWSVPGGAGERDPLQSLRARELILWPDGPPAGAEAEFQATALLGDAVLRRHHLLDRHRRASARRDAWLARLRREERRLGRLLENLEEEARRAADHGQLRRQAEALLAGLGQVRRTGMIVEVPDPRGPEGPRVRVELAAGEGPRTAADRLFRQAARGARAEARAGEKRDEAGRRLQRVRDLLAASLRVASLADLTALEESAPDWLRSPPSPPARRPTPGPEGGRRRPADPRARKVRRYTLPGEVAVLVGGGADANDYLTFRMASPHDFWLHAADYPGAHVVLRNPGRRQEPPAAALRRAAALAAHFSKAPPGGPVTVRWCQAKHVRKGRGLPPGAVLLPRARTLQVLPEGPPAGPALP